MKLKKILSIASAAVLAACCFTGCGEDEAREEAIKKATETYGYAMKEVDSPNIYRIYDSRYVSDEMVEAACNYLLSIQNNDYDLYLTVQPDEYIDAICSIQKDYAKKALENYHNSESESLGKGFKYTQIEITGITDSASDDSIIECKDTIDNLYREVNNKDLFSETVISSHAITYDLTAQIGKTDSDNSLKAPVLQNQVLYLFETAKGYVVFEY